jgi:hypothetical protein
VDFCGFTAIFYSATWFRLPIQASVKKPLLTPKVEEGRKKQRLPVVIFSHGIWACHTTYSATCVDLASHGYSYGPLFCFTCSPVVQEGHFCMHFFVEHYMNV